MEINNFYEALDFIISEEKEQEAIQLLSDVLQKKIIRLTAERNELNACIKAIRKINKGKNEAIDNLTQNDYEDYKKI